MFIRWPCLNDNSDSAAIAVLLIQTVSLFILKHHIGPKKMLLYSIFIVIRAVNEDMLLQVYLYNRQGHNSTQIQLRCNIRASSFT